MDWRNDLIVGVNNCNYIVAGNFGELIKNNNNYYY